MTRDSIPGLDLYRELEVSRQASVAAIEAAYRRLVKQHHPDVARSADLERIKRLNLAREWLTDLDRRRQYDVSRGFSPTSVLEHGGTARAPRTSADGASSEPARSFGVNADDVRIFLAGLRGLDSARARRVFDGRAVATTKGLRRARRAAAEIGQTQRKDEWLLAREAASVIARGKLGDTTLTEQVVDVIADAAGAIAIRDLLTPHDFKVVMLPWTWTSARVEPAVNPAPRGVAPTPAPRPVAKPIEARPAAFMLAGAAPDAVPAERWAEAFGTRWPPPREPAPPAVTWAPVAGEAARPAANPASLGREAALPAAPVAPDAGEPATSVPVVSARAPAAPVAAEPPRSTRVPAEPVEAVVASSPPESPASPTPATPTPAAPVAMPIAMSAGRAADPTPSRISIADLGASPWTPRSEPEPKPVKVDRTRRAPVRASARPAVRRPIWIPAAAMLLAIVAIGGVVAALSRPPSELDVAAITDDPLTPTNEATGFVVAPASAAATTEPTATDPDAPTPDPVASDRPGGGPTPKAPPPEPGATPKPTPKPTPAPTPTPAATPTPGPTPTPPPPPTPGPACLVPNFINTQATKALQKWTGQGFTGPLTIEPLPPPNFQIGWQSLAAGTMEPCTSGITVRDVAP